MLNTIELHFVVVVALGKMGFYLFTDVKTSLNECETCKMLVVKTEMPDYWIVWI